MSQLEEADKQIESELKSRDKLWEERHAAIEKLWDERHRVMSKQLDELKEVVRALDSSNRTSFEELKTVLLEHLGRLEKSSARP